MGDLKIWQKLKKSIPGNAKGRDATPLTQSPARSSGTSPLSLQKHALTEVDHAKESAHNGERHSTGTSGDSAEPCHHANERLSNDQATPPDRGPSVANLPSASSQVSPSPLPVGPPAEVSPETESGEHQAYAAAASQRVWNSAYESLKNDGKTATRGGVQSDKHDVRLGGIVVSMPEGPHGGVVLNTIWGKMLWKASR
ncbi:hypothetical protein Purlil1_12434 [Purpureocillium lilacinum]|uniref:Uncharacterized protein n=1 Tax=Purpureocillium lilacinum TaxID=33203 RepID=A0ABR0BGW3_PURLI|nr:hypothetical protein Purlil1_12434 [Purpureocillium lilacinum]